MWCPHMEGTLEHNTAPAQRSCIQWSHYQPLSTSQYQPLPSTALRVTGMEILPNSGFISLNVYTISNVQSEYIPFSYL